MRKTNAWSCQEIESLKNGFLEGTPFKILSQKLGRSPTALNKAVSRFHIRQVMRSNKSILVACTAPISVEAPPCKTRRTANALFAQTRAATIDEIINFLKDNGYDIRKKTVPCGNNVTEHYFVNRWAISATRLLVMANSIRLERKLPIFQIKFVKKRVPKKRDEERVGRGRLKG
ncbi:hypothetical protein AGMMS49949_00830 [Alphaproteobacteria bacterium]|nr:hypothetical protein AGMMS49949_00830 [Alphaproteobacteria bacterium]GHS97102.1 hypothetical protein AGMMS50296_3800 [Alphaproteobacteria bacterium]